MSGATHPLKIGEMLRERAGIDPSKLSPVIDLAALGLINSAWRNTCVEDWHAEGRMAAAVPS